MNTENSRTIARKMYLRKHMYSQKRTGLRVGENRFEILLYLFTQTYCLLVTSSYFSNIKNALIIRYLHSRIKDKMIVQG